MTEEVDLDTAEVAAPFKEITEHVDGPIAPAHGIAALALSMAMRYHDISTVKDGALYQQYKLEGKNLRSLHLDMVLETAARLEKWLLCSSERIAKVVVDALAVAVTDDEEKAGDQPDTQA
jgi:hypothetical protein